MSRSQLGGDVQTYIVRALACYDTPSDVAKAVKKEYGIDVSRQAVEAYDPDKVAGARMGKKWRAIFDAARSSFIDDVNGVPISQRPFRLRALQRMATRAESVGNLKLAAELLEQAAKEMGNAYTNRRELTGRDGKDLPAPIMPAVAVFALPDNGRDAKPITEARP